MKTKEGELTDTQYDTLQVIKLRMKRYCSNYVTIADVAYDLFLSWSAAQNRVKQLLKLKLIKRNKKKEITLN